MNEITNTASSRQALRWLARELAWERALNDLREGGTETAATPEAA